MAAMLATYPNVDPQTRLITDSAGPLLGCGPEVTSQIALAENHEDRPAVGIIMGCGALAVHYANFQVRLRDVFDISSVCTERLYVPAAHPNRFQSEAVEQSLKHAGNTYDLGLDTIYGHSWGAAILASLMNAGVYKVDLAILHAMAGDQVPFMRALRHPSGLFHGVQREMMRGHQIRQAEGENANETDLQFPSLSMAQMAVLFSQHMPAASETRNVGRHLETARRDGTRLVGLWPEYDVMFRRRHHPLLHENRVMTGSVHTETQSNPAGVAAEVASFIAAHGQKKHLSKSQPTMQTEQFAIAGA